MSVALRQWLETLGLAQYADRFAADDIDLDVLPSLSEQDLAELGVSMGHRKRLLKAIAELTGAPAPSSPAPATVFTTVSVPARRAAGTTDARKVVTIVFADLIGSTSLHEQLDAESVSRLMERYYATMRAAVAAHGGTVVKLLGDGVMAAFGVPRVAEDDAIRAVRAGVAMQDAFREFARRELTGVAGVGLRVGINTGEVVVAADDTDVVGDPVNVAARLQAEAGDGDVVLGEATRRLVASLVTLTPLGRFALKGRAESIKAYRVESLERPVGVAAAAFVGRDDELARIGAVYDAACAAPAARLAVLLGSPGLGKSRLITEVGRRLGDAASVVTAHCDAAGGATFAPIAAALRELFHIEAGTRTTEVLTTIEAAIPASDSERARVAAGIAALLADAPAAPEETFFVIRRLLTGLAAAKPVLLVIDDLHWAEPLLLDLVEHLVQWGSGTPLLVLVGARPELRDLRSSLVTPGGLVAEVVTLGGLDAGAAMRLAASVIGAADLPAAVAGKVLATSEGNPLFVGELVRMLVDEGAIERQGDRWVVGANLAAVEMPPTIHALLAARIERLGPDDRVVLERAAVVGRHFSRSAVAALLGRNGTRLDARLEALRRSELIERDTGWFLGEPVLRFHHVLIRDAAYRRLLKGTRAELHEQLADWIEAQVGDAPEHDETIGWHLEQAHQHRRELGPLDANGRALGERAARRLGAAGRRALARDDAPVAAGLLGRALERLDTRDPARAELALDWCEALLAGGDVTTAERAIAELGRFVGDAAADGAARLAAWHTCFRGQLTVLTAPQTLDTTADGVAAAAAELAALGDAAGEAKGHFVHALALARLGRVGGCEAALDKALAAARRADDRRRANTVLAIAPLAALWGPSPVTRASGRCLDVVRVLRITQGAPAVEAVALSCQAVLEALRGRADAARRMIAAARKMVEDLGIQQRLFETDAFGGLIDLLEGDAAAAERSLRGAYHGLRDLGLGIDAARAAALLARALLVQDRAQEAEALSHESEALAGDDLKAAIAWRGVRAEALARRGEQAAAVELAQAAVGIAAATDALLDHADARLALAAALRAAGRDSDAEAEERRAIELWEAKGAVLLVERTRRAEARGAATAATPQSSGAPAPRRRVSPNAASKALVALNAAMAAPDFVALRAQVSESYEEIDHPTGTSYGHDATFAALERLMRSRDASCRHEPLATLGDALVLSRRRVHASATGGGRFDVGEYEQEAYSILEVDPRGRFCRHEVFAADRLHDARVRLFARQAELLPAGPERTWAAAVVRSLEIFRRAETDPDSLVAALAPDLEGVDHRHLSSHSVHSAAAYIDHLQGWRQVADDLVFRERDILALVPRAMLVATLHTGNARNGGGAYERSFLTLFVLDQSGRFARVEWFDDDRADDALARFDEIVAGGVIVAPQPAARRRVTPNAATANAERFGAAVAARDLDAVARVLCEEVETLHHQTGVTYGRKGFLATWRSMFHAAEMSRRQETIASLGDTLALAHHTIRLEGFTEEHIADVGAVDIDEVVLFEVDDSGRTRRFDIFPVEKLGDAVVRLYERHADLLPEGPERARAAATARAVAVWNGPLDIVRVAAVTGPLVELVDHRSLHLWSARGAEEYLEQWRGHFALTETSVRTDGVLALECHALLVRRTYFGTAREGGGEFVTPVLELWVYGADGRSARIEVLDPDAEAEALARFDDLVASAAPRHAVRRRVTPNAGSAAMARVDAALAAGDLDAFAAEIGPDFVEISHPNGVTYGRDAMLRSVEHFLRLPGATARHELLATLGERLWLLRRWMGASAAGRTSFDVAEFEKEEIGVHELDEHGRALRNETFAGDRLGDALVRLYERHAELLPDGAQKTRVAAIARSLATFDGRLDLDRIRAAYDPSSFRNVDHRVFGTWSVDSAEEMLRHFRLQLDLAPDFSGRYADVLAADAHGMVARMTFFGTARDSGGRFENHLAVLQVWGADGCTIRSEIFEAEQVAEALARFDELTRGPEIHERFANAATRNMDRFMRASHASDWQGVVDVFAPDLRFEDRRPLLRMELRRDAFLEQHRVIFDVPNGRWTSTVLATRGDRLALWRLGLHGDVGDDGGPLEIAYLCVGGAGDDGRFATIVLFEPGDLDAACAELDARYEAGEGAIHPPVASRLREALARRDWDAIAALCAPGFTEHDHRCLAVLGTSPSPEAWVASFRALLELAPDSVARWEHIRPCPRGGLWTMRWEGTRDGGRYEIPLVGVTEADANGTFARSDFYDPEQIDLALARFAELSRSTEAPAHFANAVTRMAERFVRATDARDWTRLADLFAADLRFDDRRPLLRMELPKEGFLVQFRVLFDVPNAHWTATTLATRGERLALFRLTLHGDVGDDGGPLEIEHLWVGGVDDDGRCDTIVLFEPDDLDDAWAELDARYVAEVGTRHPHVTAVVLGTRRPFLDRDWDGFSAAHAPDVVCHDHRLLGWGTVYGVEAWTRTQQVLVELAPDTGARVTHLDIAERGALRSIVLFGTRDGGPFELAFLRVDEIEASGRTCRIDLFDADGIDAALARFAELRSPARTTALARFENTASRAWRAVIDADHAGLHAALDDLHRRFLRYRDHRRFVQLDLDRAGLRDFMTALPPMRAKHGSFDLVATRGDRLALTHHSLAMDDDTVGPSVIESLMLVETDEDGNIVAYDRWDPDELDAAYAELDARYEAGDAAPHRPCREVMRGFVRAIAQRDFAAVAALCAESMVEYDHRSLAVLGTTRGADAWARNFGVLADLSADTAYRVDHFRTAARGFLALGCWHGTRAGGPYEIPLHAVIELDERGRIVRADIHDDDGIEAARARFAELGASGATPSPSLVKSTAATAALERLYRHFDAQDWDAVRAACSRDFTWQDRRPIVGISGDVELMIASARERMASGARHERREILGTAGDRVAIGRVLWAGGPAGGRFEVEFLSVFEIDADGLLTAMIFFEPDDLRAAQREAWARWAAVDPTVAEMTTYAGAVVDAWNAQDPDRMRALLSEDLVAADHRRTGIGRSEGREAYLRSVVALWELAPDSHLEAGLVWLAHAPHAGLYLCRRQGVLPDGGEFVSEFLALAVVERGLTARLEVFEPDAADAALARFTELCSAPLRIPPNAVTRAWDRRCTAAAAGDWDTIGALYHPSYRSEDRRPLMRLTTDLAGILENDRILAEGGWLPTRTLLATAGDRLALQHILWRTGAAGGDSEIETLQLSEVDAEGRFVSGATFDPGDRADAFRELEGRHLALTRPSAIPQLEARRDAGRDLARLRAAFPDDFFFHDHRRTGLGRIDGADAYVRSVAALHELAPEAMVGVPLHFLADEPHGTLSIAHSFGTLADGGAFESVYAMIMLYGPDGMTGVELFELDDLETAKARFAELRATQTG